MSHHGRRRGKLWHMSGVPFDFDRLSVPVVLAPMAGGPSTVDLAAAVSDAGGLGFLAAGYLPVETVAEQLAELSNRTSRPWGLNIFSPPAPEMPATVDAVEHYRMVIEPLSGAAGVALGEARWDDDGYDAKVALAAQRHVPVVSFTFGCPTADVVDRLHGAGCSVWVTVTDAAEALAAAELGVDVLVAQGAEAGGHRGSFLDDDDDPYPLTELLTEVRHLVPDLPLVAAGGIMDGAGIATVLRQGAVAAQLGTAFLRCPEAATNAVARAAVGTDAPTALSRAFTGRLARGIVNTWTAGVGQEAPSAYPQVHHLTSPLRAHGRAAGDIDLVNVFAGTNHRRSRELPAADLVRALHQESRAR
jgi:nitronate monooxygenase